MVDDWKSAPLGELLRQSEETIEVDLTENYQQITVRMWGNGVVSRGWVTGDELGSSRWYVAHKGQFILSKIDARHGAFGLVPPELEGAIVSNDFPLFDIDASKALPQYLYWLSRTHDFVDLCKRASEGTTNRVRLKLDRFLAAETPLPPLDEQRRIVAHIDALAEQIAAARGLRHGAVEELETLLPSVISHLPFSPNHWGTVETVILDISGAIRSGPFGSQLHHEEFTQSGVAAIGTRDVQTNRFVRQSGWYISEEKFMSLKRYQVFPDDILVTIIGGSIGRFCVVPPDCPVAFTTKHVVAMTLNQAIAVPKFVSYMLNYHQISRQSIFAQIEGSAQPSLNISKVKAIKIPAPELSLQREILGYLADLESHIESQKRLQADTAAELDALLPSLLDRAFRGEL